MPENERPRPSLYVKRNILLRSEQKIHPNSTNKIDGFLDGKFSGSDVEPIDWLSLAPFPQRGGSAPQPLAPHTPFRDRSHLYSCNGDACSESNSSRSHLVVGRIFVCCLAKNIEKMKAVFICGSLVWMICLGSEDIKAFLVSRDTPSSIWCIDCFATLISREKISL